eukprot:5294889-Amphidinium_carterae.1
MEKKGFGISTGKPDTKQQKRLISTGKGCSMLWYQGESVLLLRPQNTAKQGIEAPKHCKKVRWRSE